MINFKEPVETMNIYALEGHKVMITEITKDYGRDYCAEMMNDLINSGKMKLNTPYTVNKTMVDSCETSVELKEFPNNQFNSVNFVDCVRQSEEDDKKHIHYIYYE